MGPGGAAAELKGSLAYIAAGELTAMASPIIVESIVASVRAATLRDGAHMDLTDPWDEGASGAGWLENEVGMVTEHILAKLRPAAVYNMAEFRTVDEFKEGMQRWSIADLRLIQHCVVGLGGSASPELWAYRGATPEQLRGRFARFGVFE